MTPFWSSCKWGRAEVDAGRGERREKSDKESPVREKERRARQDETVSASIT
jgi:hypothetical protein